MNNTIQAGTSQQLMPITAGPESWISNFSSDLEISTAFVKSLEVLFIVHFFQSQSLPCLVSVLDFQTRVLTSQRVSDFTIRHRSYFTANPRPKISLCHLQCKANC